jgi:hypothetical protein
MARTFPDAFEVANGLWPPVSPIVVAGGGARPIGREGPIPRPGQTAVFINDNTVRAGGGGGAGVWGAAGMTWGMPGLVWGG